MTNFNVMLSGSTYKYQFSSQSNRIEKIKIRNTRNNYIPTVNLDIVDIKSNLHDKIDINDDIIVSIDDSRIFSGKITNKSLEWSGIPTIKLTCVGDVEALFNKKTKNKRYRNRLTGEIASDLMDTYYPEYFYNTDDNGDIVYKDITFNNWSVGKCLTYLADGEDATFWVSPDPFKASSGSFLGDFSTLDASQWDLEIGNDDPVNPTIYYSQGYAKIYARTSTIKDYGWAKYWDFPAVAYKVKLDYKFLWLWDDYCPSNQIVIRLLDANHSVLENIEVTPKFAKKLPMKEYWYRDKVIKIRDTDIDSNIEDIRGMQIIFSGAKVGSNQYLAHIDNVKINRYSHIFNYKPLPDTSQFQVTEDNLIKFKNLEYSRDYIRNSITLTGGRGWDSEYSGVTPDCRYYKRADRKYFIAFKPSMNTISRIRIPMSGMSNDTGTGIGAGYFRMEGDLYDCLYMITQSGGKLNPSIGNKRGTWNREWTMLSGNFFTPTKESGANVDLSKGDTKYITFDWDNYEDIKYIHTNIMVSSNAPSGSLLARWKFIDRNNNWKSYDKTLQCSSNARNSYLVFDDVVDFHGISKAVLSLYNNSDTTVNHKCYIDCAGLFAKGYDDTKVYRSKIDGNIPITHYPYDLGHPISRAKESRGFGYIKHYKAYLSGSEEANFIFPDTPTLDTNNHYIFSWYVSRDGLDKTDGYLYSWFTEGPNDDPITFYLSAPSSQIGNYALYCSEHPQSYYADNMSSGNSLNLSTPHKHSKGLAIQIGYGSDKMQVTYRNEDSIKKYGIREYTKTFPHMDYDNMKQLSKKTAEKYSSGCWTGKLTINGNKDVALSQKFDLYLNHFNISGQYEIGAYEHNINNKSFTTTIELSTPKYDIVEDLNRFNDNELL